MARADSIDEKINSDAFPGLALEEVNKPFPGCIVAKDEKLEEDVAASPFETLSNGIKGLRTGKVIVKGVAPTERNFGQGFEDLPLVISQLTGGNGTLGMFCRGGVIELELLIDPALCPNVGEKAVAPEEGIRGNGEEREEDKAEDPGDRSVGGAVPEDNSGGQDKACHLDQNEETGQTNIPDSTEEVFRK